jgi:Uma2 family endonuclease
VRTEGHAELLVGKIVMMAGATRRHNRVTRNILEALDGRFGDGPYEAFVANMQVKAEEAEACTYPDVVVTCADAEFEDELDDTLTNPLAIFEVLLPSIRGRDRGDRFAYTERSRLSATTF